MTSLKTQWTDGARRLFASIGVVLASWRITADMLTISGLVLHVVATPLVIWGQFGWAAVILVVAALCDGLDGAVARAGVGTTKAGAFLDSTTDRISELLVSSGLILFFAREERWYETVAMLVLLGAAQLVSYARARAEALGVECKVGFMSRPERVVGLLLGFALSGVSIAGVNMLTFFVYLVAVLTALTVVTRFRHVMRALRALD
ncbi:MAG: CDP-alcohol phosphatidyltransferase family protein [Thermoleophilia bacterium]